MAPDFPEFRNAIDLATGRSSFQEAAARHRALAAADRVRSDGGKFFTIRREKDDIRLSPASPEEASESACLLLPSVDVKSAQDVAPIAKYLLGISGVDPEEAKAVTYIHRRSFNVLKADTRMFFHDESYFSDEDKELAAAFFPGGKKPCTILAYSLGGASARMLENALAKAAPGENLSSVKVLAVASLAPPLPVEDRRQHFDTLSVYSERDYLLACLGTQNAMLNYGCTYNGDSPVIVIQGAESVNLLIRDGQIPDFIKQGRQPALVNHNGHGLRFYAGFLANSDFLRGIRSFAAGAGLPDASADIAWTEETARRFNSPESHETAMPAMLERWANQQRALSPYRGATMI